MNKYRSHNCSELNEKDIDFASIGDNTFLKQGNSINKINILFNKIEKKND